MKPVTISDPARKEYREAVEWYRDRDERVAARLADEARSMLELIKTLGKEKTLILSSHNLSDVDEVCNHTAVLSRGQLIYSGSLQDLKGRMRRNHQSAKKTKGVGKFPAPAKQKEVGPKSPGCELRDNQERDFSVDPKSRVNQTNQRGIRREKSNVGNFHYLVIDRRNDGLIAAINNVAEPVTVMLDQADVAIGNRPLRCKQ